VSPQQQQPVVALVEQMLTAKRADPNYLSPPVAAVLQKADAPALPSKRKRLSARKN